MVYHQTEKKGIINLLKNKGFYAIVGLCVVAAGTGIFAARQSNNNAQAPIVSSATDGQPSTISWQPYTTPTDNADSAVNMPASDVPDERETEPKETKAPAETTQDSNTPFTGEYSLPFGTDIIRDYSNGELVYVPTLDDWRSHDGVDFGGTLGNDIIAIQDGKIKSVIRDELWGNVVEIEHGNGVLARYCGFDKDTLPKEGDSVKRDEVLGKLGEIPIEAMDAPHFHLEIRVNDKVVDPLEAMNKLGEQG